MTDPLIGIVLTEPRFYVDLPILDEDGYVTGHLFRGYFCCKSLPSECAGFFDTLISIAADHGVTFDIEGGVDQVIALDLGQINALQLETVVSPTTPDIARQILAAFRDQYAPGAPLIDATKGKPS